MKTNIKNLSRADLIQHLQGRPRAEVLEAALQLHANQDNRNMGDVKVPLRTAVAMAALASPSEQRRLRKESPDLFECKPTALDLEAGKRAVWAVYKSIDISARGGAAKRKSLRDRYNQAFS